MLIDDILIMELMLKKYFRYNYILDRERLFKGVSRIEFHRILFALRQLFRFYRITTRPYN